MRTGLTVSALAHAGLIALAIFGLAMGKPLVTPPVESIAVDLVPISEFSNIRVGSLDSKIVETETPSAVEDVKPAELAKPTGNTEKDQPKPANNPDPTPAPTEQTAPAPRPADPVVEPEPTPAPVPVAVRPPQPAPEPTPVEEPPAETVEAEPALAAPVESPDPADVAPKPLVKNTSLADKRAAYKKQVEAEKQKKAEEARKAEEEKKRKEAERKKAEEQKRIERAKADEAAKLADEVANIINNEQSRGSTTGSGGTPTLGKADGRSATLSKSEIDGLVAQILECLNVPAGAAEAGVSTLLEFTIDPAGMVRQQPRVVNAPASPLEQALASAAQRAVLRCGPYMVTDQQVRATFDPRQF